MARERLPLVAHAGEPVANGSHGGIQVQLAAVLRPDLVPGEPQAEVAGRLVRLLAERDAHELSIGELFPVVLPALGEELADGRQEPDRALMLVLVRVAGP